MSIYQIIFSYFFQLQPVPSKCQTKTPVRDHCDPKAGSFRVWTKILHWIGRIMNHIKGPFFSNWHSLDHNKPLQAFHLMMGIRKKNQPLQEPRQTNLCAGMSQDDYHPPSHSKCLSSLKPFNYLELHGLWWTWYQIWLLQKKWYSPKKPRKKSSHEFDSLGYVVYLVKTYGTWHEKKTSSFCWDSDKFHTFSDDWRTKNVLFHMFLCLFSAEDLLVFFLRWNFNSIGCQSDSWPIEWRKRLVLTSWWSKGRGGCSNTPHLGCNRHHQDYYIFSEGESQPKPLFATLTG